MASLKDTLVSSEVYNSLPHISDVSDAPDQHSTDLASLRSLLMRHNVPAGVSVRLIHKHFDTRDNEVMAFKQVVAQPFGELLVMRPALPDPSRLHGVNYFVDESGSLQAYEYTESDVTDMSSYVAFMKEFCAFILERGLQRKFGLKLQSSWQVAAWTEFEFPSERSTIIVPKGMPVPEDNGGINVITEWDAGSSEDGSEGSKAHGWCTAHPRNCRHCGHHESQNDKEGAWMSKEWYLGGNKVEPGSAVHSLVAAVVEVW